jgi:hypothetical protein
VIGRLLGPDGCAASAPRPRGSPSALVFPAVARRQNGSGGTGFSFRNQGDNGVFYGRTTFDRASAAWTIWFSSRGSRTPSTFPRRKRSGRCLGAFGPNDTGKSARTEIYGADLFYKWKSAHAAGGWPFVKWQSEILGRRFEADRGVDDQFPVSETFDDWGAYSQVVWGFYRGWTAGLRGDFLHMEDSSFTDDPERQSRWRIAPDVSWYPTEFSKFRLQYNHDFLEANHFTGSSNADSVFLQFEFSLGAHGAHKF